MSKRSCAVYMCELKCVCVLVRACRKHNVTRALPRTSIFVHCVCVCMWLWQWHAYTHTWNHLEYFCFGFASSHADRSLSNVNQKKRKKDLFEGKRTHKHIHVLCVWASNSPKLFGSGLVVSKSKHATGISYTQRSEQANVSFSFFPLFNYGTKRHRSHKIFQLFFNSMQW